MLRAVEYEGEVAELLKGDEDLIRGFALEALGLFGIPTYAGTIAACLKDENAWVRCNALTALGRLEAKEHAKNIADLLNDSAVCIVYSDVIKDPTTVQFRTSRDATVGSLAAQVLKDWGMSQETSKER